MSVSWGTQYAKLKTNLRLAANRLRLLQKKKTEQAMKARTEIANFLSTDKEDRARIRVESIIREDFVVEAYELLEMFCELLLARFGLIQQMKELDDGIAEAVSSLLWVAPRISHEVSEFKVINDQLQQKYGKQFAEAARMNQLPEPSRVSPKLLQKLSVNAPSKILVEKYLIEIARCANIDFTPDPKVMRDDDDEIATAERNLINFMTEEQIGWNLASGGPPAPNANNPPGGGNYGTNNFGGPPPPRIGHGGGSSGGGGGGATDPYYQTPPHYVSPAPNNAGNNAAGQQMYPSQPRNSFIQPPDHQAPHMPPAQQAPHMPPAQHYEQPHSFGGQQPAAGPPPYNDSQIGTNEVKIRPNFPDSTNTPPTKPQEHIYEVPPVSVDDFLSQFPEPPTDLPSGGGGGHGGGNVASKKSSGGPNDNLDFDDLAKRFQELKKRL